MSLVIAQRDETGISISSDTRVTPRDESRGEPTRGTLKCLALRPYLAVAYAGLVRPALSTIRELAARHDLDIREIRERLIRTSVESEGAVEFILADLSSNSLTKISGAQVEEDMPIVWIGDEQVYRSLQTIRFSSGKTSRNDLGELMRDVLGAGARLSAGDFVIVLRSSNSEFVYQERLELYVESVTIVGSGEPVPVPFQTSSFSGYSEYLMAPVQPGVPAAAIYLTWIATGLLFLPLVDEFPIKFSGLSQSDFRDVVLERYGIELGGGLEVG